MFNVVVDSEQTGKLLLEKGGLQRRITIIPLNKIQASGVPGKAQAAATKLVDYLHLKFLPICRAQFAPNDNFLYLLVYHDNLVGLLKSKNLVTNCEITYQLLQKAESFG